MNAQHFDQLIQRLHATYDATERIQASTDATLAAIKQKLLHELHGTLDTPDKVHERMRWLDGHYYRLTGQFLLPHGDDERSLRAVNTRGAE